METKAKNTFKNVYLNKNWVLVETSKAVKILSPDHYFKTNDEKCNRGIWFSKDIIFKSLKFDNQFVVGINEEQNYEIITSYPKTANKQDTKEIIKGKDLYEQFIATKQQIKAKYYPNNAKTIGPVTTTSEKDKWLK